MNKKVLVYLCCLILFISVSLNIFFISYSNNVKRSTNLIINNMVNLVENKYSGVVVEDIIKELNSSELKETSLSKYGIDISDFISLKMKNDNLKYLIILNIIVTCLSLFIIIYNLILKSYKNKKIKELTDLIKEINNKNYVLDMKDNVEDDTSILKSELYKTTIMLKESAENSLKDKLSIKEFIEDTSHQLKTLLASISIILDNLIDNPNMDNKLRESFLKDINVIKNALEKYHGVGRRFEFLGTYKDALIYDDYAHHPSEIKTTLESVKSVKHNESWAIFQSHTYSRTAEHLDAFADILSKFDHVIIAKIFPAREINIYNISEDMLVNKIKEQNPNVCYIEDFNKIIEYLDENIKPNDLVISIGAGPINANVTKKLIEK